MGCRVHSFVRQVKLAGTQGDNTACPAHGLLTMQALATALTEQLVSISGRLQSAVPMLNAISPRHIATTILLGLQQALQVRYLSASQPCKSQPPLQD